MPNLWRISKYVELSGEGGRRSSNRWNRRGRPIVYLGESVAGVVLENLVHLMDQDDHKLPEGLKLIQVQYPSNLECDEVLESTLAEDWRSKAEITQDVGDHWLRHCKTALLRVPSAVVPCTSNFLLNPQHPDWRLVIPTEPFAFDLEPRLKQLADFARSYRKEIRFVSPDE